MEDYLSSYHSKSQLPFWEYFFFLSPFDIILYNSVLCSRSSGQSWGDKAWGLMLCEIFAISFHFERAKQTMYNPWNIW